MGLRLAYYYSGFITGCVNIFLSTVLLFTINSPQPDKDKLFLPYYIFLKMQLALPIPYSAFRRQTGVLSIHASARHFIWAGRRAEVNACS